jgi:hypothetical protein
MIQAHARTNKICYIDKWKKIKDINNRAYKDKRKKNYRAIMCFEEGNQ